MTEQTPTEPPKLLEPETGSKRLSIRHLVLYGGMLATSIVVGVFLLVLSADNSSPASNRQSSPAREAAVSENAIEVGKQLSGDQCTGTGSGPLLSVSPMKAEDFSHIEPYGLMIGGHVTPIDHQYYSPIVFRSPKDAYEVRAMGDATIVSIETHPTRTRLVFSVSCTFFYYYDLLTSVEPGINEKALPISVKAGQLIGHIGGQTLDFAAWDTTKPLKGFVVPAHYAAESWKLYIADPLDYYTDDLKALTLSKYVRTAEPRSGKIDYDIDGKLIGTWFQDGTNGYGGHTEANESFWEGHLSIVPNHYDPSAIIVSVGYLAPANGAPDNQFSVPQDSPDPATITPDSGLVKYELKRWNYRKADGTIWDSMSPATSVTVSNLGQQTIGCALVQMTQPRKLKFETFMGKDCTTVKDFKSPRTYER